MNGIFELSQLVEFARINSPFYRELYANLPKTPKLQDLPLIDQNKFWQANRINENRVLTTKQQPDGIVFKSGGTTGEAKFSYFTKSEWESFTQQFGKGLVHGGLRAGEKVINLFYAGELYASFLFIMKSLENSGVPVVHFPAAGNADFETVAKLIEDFKVDTIAGVPTSILNFTEYLRDKKSLKSTLPLKRILFGGESMYQDQRERVCEYFKGVKLQSIGYASVDGGQLGYAKPDSGPDVHHCFSESTIMEIIDEESNQVINEMGKRGRLFVTNLTRRLMPIIRYPVGDMAEWIDPVNTVDRRFCILGRSAEGARLGPATLYFDDLREIISSLSQEISIPSFQMLITHHEFKDQLILRLSNPDPSTAKLWSPKLIEKLLLSRPMLKDLISNHTIHPPLVEWVYPHNMEINARTGKLKHVIDLRKA